MYKMNKKIDNDSVIENIVSTMSPQIKKSIKSVKSSVKPMIKNVKSSVKKTLKKTTNLVKKTFTNTKKRKRIIPQINLGKIPSSYISNIKFVPNTELSNFVNTCVNDGPQIVSLPVPPYRHAFFVDIDSKKRKIMISDWNGSDSIILGLKTLKNGEKNKKYDKSWSQYSDFMVLLEEKYGFEIEVYPVNKEIFSAAKKHNTTMGGGGCSYYIFAWIPTIEKYDDYEI